MNRQASVPESQPTNADGTPYSSSLPFSNPDCPFCTIISSYPPISPISQSTSTLRESIDHYLDPNKLDPPAYVLLSTEHVIAFLDVYPLTRGHVLVCPRRHVEKAGGMKREEATEIGNVLPLLSRAIMSACMPDIPHEDVDYNVVQNNGPGAAQVVPHAHFHIVPRYPFEYVPPSTKQLESMLGKGNEAQGAELGSERGMRSKAKVPEGLEATRILFGRGQRHYRDEEDAQVLVRVMREKVSIEWEREFGKAGEEALEISNGHSRLPDGNGQKSLPLRTNNGKL